MESKNRYSLIAVSCFVALLMSALCAANLFAANAAGKVSFLSGPLFAKKADGSMKTLARDSLVEVGDTLITEKRTYTRIKFNDNSEITLRPDSKFKVEAFSYHEAKPKEDKAVNELIKGGLRSLSGHIGKRGDPDSYKMKTRAAVIGIRGTVYEVKICEGNCGELSDGIYFFVPEGSIIISNGAGSITVGAGQYVYVKDTSSSPVVLRENPGIDFKIPENVGSNWNCIVR